MTTSMATTTITTGYDVTVRPALWRTGLVAGVAAAVATTAVAGGALAAGVSLESGGEHFPIAGFAQLTLLFTAVGVLIARTIARRAHRPRSTWIRTTVALTALSFVPDALLSADFPTKSTLVLTHIVAAVIVVPALARRLADERA